MFSVEEEEEMENKPEISLANVYSCTHVPKDE